MWGQIKSEIHKHLLLVLGGFIFFSFYIEGFAYLCTSRAVLQIIEVVTFLFGFLCDICPNVLGPHYCCWFYLSSLPMLCSVVHGSLSLAIGVTDPLQLLKNIRYRV